MLNMINSERWYPKGAEVKVIPETDLEVGILTKEDPDRIPTGNRPWLVGYYGKQKRPAFNYTFKSAEAMEKYLAEIIAGRKATLKMKADIRAERKAKLAEPNPLQVGDILRSSWGYDQTNVDYYQVLELVGKRSVMIQEIGCESVPGSGGFMSDQVKPAPGMFCKDSKPMLKRVGSGGSVKVRDWGCWAYKVDPASSTYRSWYA